MVSNKFLKLDEKNKEEKYEANRQCISVQTRINWPVCRHSTRESNWGKYTHTIYYFNKWWASKIASQRFKTVSVAWLVDFFTNYVYVFYRLTDTLMSHCAFFPSRLHRFIFLSIFPHWSEVHAYEFNAQLLCKNSATHIAQAHRHIDIQCTRSPRLSLIIQDYYFIFHPVYGLLLFNRF